MRHFVLTRSAFGSAVFGPAYSLEANRRRLRLLEGVTVPSMRAQTETRWTWIVLVDEADPLLVERKAAFESAGVLVRYLPFAGGTSMYRAPWATAAGLPSDEATLMTRLDDDDALAPDALQRIRMAAEASDHSQRMVWMLPEGYRIYKGRYSSMRHEANMFATLQVPSGDTATVYDYGHKKAARFAEVRMVDDNPGWLFVRHPDTRSNSRHVEHRITVGVRSRFPIDWSLCE